MVDSFVRFHVFHERLLMYETNILSILQDTEVAETKFGETLVDQVNRRVDIEGDGRLIEIALVSISKC